jgi:acetyltransferase-like isoleucine patch superfamily enzyme
MTAARALPWDWYPGTIPDNVLLDPSAYVETTYSFRDYRSRAPAGVRMGAGASVYQGVMFDVGPRGEVILADYAMLNGGRVLCDSRIEIGEYALLSWNVVLMDSYRLPAGAAGRRLELQRAARHEGRVVLGVTEAKPIRIGRNVWIGFDACILPGVTIGEGSIVGARSVVIENVPPFTVAAGNPARVIRRIEER